MKCSECGQDNPQNPRYCTRCGYFLASSDPGNGPGPAQGGRGHVRETKGEDGLFSEVPRPQVVQAPGSMKTRLDEEVPAARMVGWMVTCLAGGQDYAFTLRAGRNRVGRGRDNEVSLFFEPKASDSHATIIWRAGSAAVKDEGSTNGTFVNGRDIGIGQVSPLASGDTLKIGGTVFLVYLVDPGRAAELWPDSGWGK